MTHRLPNSDALALNAAWKRKQAALLHHYSTEAR